MSPYNPGRESFQVNPYPGSDLVHNCCHATFHVKEDSDHPSLWVLRRFANDPFTNKSFELPLVQFKWATMQAQELYDFLLEFFRDCTPDKVRKAYRSYQHDLEVEMAMKETAKRFRS